MKLLLESPAALLMLISGAVAQALYTARYDLSFPDNGSPGFTWSKTFDSSLSAVVWYQKIELISTDLHPLLVVGASRVWRHTAHDMVDMTYKMIYQNVDLGGQMELSYTGVIPSEYIITVFLTTDPWHFDNNARYVAYPGHGSGNYTNYAYYKKIITWSDYTCSRLILHHVDVEECCDKIAIMKDLQHIVQLNSSVNNGIDVIIPKDTFFVQFTSDISIVGRGFILEYFGTNCSVSTGTLRPSIECTISSFRIPDSTYLDFYSNNYYRTVTISSASSEHRILVYISHMQTEWRYDSVSIYYGGRIRHHLSGRIVGWTQILPTARATLQYFFDGTIPGHGGRLSYCSVARNVSLPKTWPMVSSRATTLNVSQSEGIITSPNFPVNYSSNLREETYVYGRTGGFLCLHADVIDLHSGCCDEIKILVSGTDGDIVLDTDEPRCFLANYLRIIFISDSSGTGRGFSLNVTSSLTVPPQSVFPTKFHSGWLRFSTTRRTRLTRAWAIGGPSGNITLVFEYFHTSVNYGRLRIINPSNLVLLDLLKGELDDGHRKVYPSSQLILIYSCEYFGEYQAFKIRYFNDVDPKQDEAPNALAWALPLGLVIFIAACITGGVVYYRRQKRLKLSATNESATAGTAVYQSNTDEPSAEDGGAVTIRATARSGATVNETTDSEETCRAKGSAAASLSPDTKPKRKRKRTKPRLSPARQPARSGRRLAPITSPGLSQLDNLSVNSPWRDAPPSYEAAVSPEDDADNHANGYFV